MARAMKLSRASRMNAANRLVQKTLAHNLSGGFAGGMARRSIARSMGGLVALDALQKYLPSAPGNPAAKSPKKPAKPKKPAVARKPAKLAKARKAPGRGSFAELRYEGPEGSLDYWLYLPAQGATGLPVVVMLHGCTQTPGDFARGTGMNALADELGLIVAYPSQPASANIARCWNWFKPGDQQRDGGEPALIAAMTRAILADTDADATRVYVAGLSAGGAAAAILGATYPDVYTAIGVHSGLACGAASDMMSAFSAMRNGSRNSRTSPDDRESRFVPVITFHGDNDATVHAINSAQIVAKAAEHIGTPLTVKRQRGGTAAGRSYTREMNCSADGVVQIEQWTIHGAGHAWSGGHNTGTYTDASGPDASRAMIAFFLQHRLD
ncbi:hypothetical protein GCM10010833_29420 [Blastomonas aquatica]|uniref:Esterase n=2 Tax=Blastomonas aquatica TaxID=1510276 RepID=A0ABQ1JLT4_9SPHN|nr:hypothetical protein GCM10010833_29420 [Blastomonas aquatica]